MWVFNPIKKGSLSFKCKTLKDKGCYVVQSGGLFISDFKADKIQVIPLSDLEDFDIEFSIDDIYTTHSHKLKKTFPTNKRR